MTTREMCISTQQYIIQLPAINTSKINNKIARIDHKQNLPLWQPTPNLFASPTSAGCTVPYCTSLAAFSRHTDWKGHTGTIVPIWRKNTQLVNGIPAAGIWLSDVIIPAAGASCESSYHHIRFWYLRCCGCPGLRGRQHLATPHTRSPWIPV